MSLSLESVAYAFLLRPCFLLCQFAFIFSTSVYVMSYSLSLVCLLSSPRLSNKFQKVHRDNTLLGEYEVMVRSALPCYVFLLFEKVNKLLFLRYILLVLLVE